MRTSRATACALAVASAACGSSGPPAAPSAPAAIPTPARGSDDLAVARVNGRAVWSSCVAAQLPHARSPREALDQCIAFELLAQAADARGLAGDREVVDARRAALVNRLVETDFEQRYRTAADLKEAVDAVWPRVAYRMHLIQLRASTFARFVVPDKAPADVDARARAAAAQLAAELAGQTGLFNLHLIEAAQRIAKSDPSLKLEYDNVKPTHQDGLVDEYAKALYAIPEVGETTKAFRTPWGWDVVLWTGGIEPKDTSRDDLIAELLPDLRRRQFQLWATQIAKRLGVHIELEQAAISALDNGDDGTAR